MINAITQKPNRKLSPVRPDPETEIKQPPLEPPEEELEPVSSSSASSSLSLRTTAARKGDLLKIMLKDIRLALDLAKEYGVPMPVGAPVEQRFIETAAAGYGEKSTSSVILPLEKLTGVEVRAKK